MVQHQDELSDVSVATDVPCDACVRPEHISYYNIHDYCLFLEQMTSELDWPDDFILEYGDPFRQWN